jgi:CubicO group peptidase (beta-lactamase class C family)
MDSESPNDTGNSRALYIGIIIAKTNYHCVHADKKRSQLSPAVKGLRRMILIFLVVLLILGAGLYVLAPHVPATPKQVKDLNELEAYLNQLVSSGNPPGLSVIVVKNEQIVYNNAFGYADRPRNIKATPDTVYHWWSMTKIPTAMAITQLCEQGKLDLDDPVKKYLPWFEVIYPSGESSVITIRNLLQHTSGLPDTIPAMIGWVHYDDTARNQTDIVRKHFPEFNTLKFDRARRLCIAI